MLKGAHCNTTADDILLNPKEEEAFFFQSANTYALPSKKHLYLNEQRFFLFQDVHFGGKFTKQHTFRPGLFNEILKNPNYVHMKFF